MGTRCEQAATLQQSALLEGPQLPPSAQPCPVRRRQLLRGNRHEILQVTQESSANWTRDLGGRCQGRKPLHDLIGRGRVGRRRGRWRGGNELVGPVLGVLDEPCAERLGARRHVAHLVLCDRVSRRVLFVVKPTLPLVQGRAPASGQARAAPSGSARQTTKSAVVAGPRAGPRQAQGGRRGGLAAPSTA